ncbi:hypothetical protein [Peribacillus asahii]|uniref:hypothetical protein n=1 Tax=Peribacillus asahii TaxID=228899 RepID=UPI00207A1E7B|nr:hypothetical protein [Peribacillus asahii]USK87529.1 hypothetical protein LIT35_24070 [Peribacillus asahii]
MDWKKVEMFLSSGQAFIPVYAENKGDSVLMYLKDGSTEMLDIQCESFLAKLLYYFGTSVSANRNRYGKLVGKRNLVPIVLSYGMTLVPYTVREPIGRQTRTGWFLAKEISHFHKKSQHHTVVQLSQHEVSVMHSEKFCFEQLKNARCIELCYGEIHEPYRKNSIFSAG